MKMKPVHSETLLILTLEEVHRLRNQVESLKKRVAELKGRLEVSEGQMNIVRDIVAGPQLTEADLYAMNSYQEPVR